jgi:tetratricopeptide (TPR) repeat protein
VQDSPGRSPALGDTNDDGALDSVSIPPINLSFDIKWGRYLSPGDKLLAAGLDALNEGKTPDAIDKLTRAANRYIFEANSQRDRSQTLWILGLVHLQNGDAAKGAEALELAAEVGQHVNAYQIRYLALTLLVLVFSFQNNPEKADLAAEQAARLVHLGSTAMKVQLYEHWARALMLGNKPAKALEKLELALPLARDTLENKAALQRLLVVEAWAYAALGDRNGADDSFSRALLLCVPQDDLCRASMHAWRADSWRAVNDYDRAESEYSEAADAYHKAANLIEEGKFLAMLGKFQERMGHSSRAAVTWEQALTVLEHSGDSKRLKNVQLALSHLYRQMGRNDKAIEIIHSLQEDLVVEVDGKPLTITAQDWNKLIEHVENSPDLARTICQEYMNSSEKRHYIYGIAEAHLCWAKFQIDAGDVAAGLSHIDRAAAGFEQSNASDQLTVSTLYRGLALSMLGRYADAESALLRALHEFETSANTLGEVEAKNALGELYLIRARYREAMTYFQGAWTIADKLDHRRQAFNNSASLTVTAYQSGVPLPLFSDTLLQGATTLVAGNSDARILLNIGRLQLKSHERAKAREAFEKALDIAVDLQNRLVEAQCHILLGETDDKPVRKRRHLVRAMELADLTRIPELVSRSRYAMAQFEISEHQYERAIELLEKSRVEAREVGAVEMEAEADLQLAILSERSKPAAAERLYDEAIALREEIRTHAPSFSLQLGLGSVGAELYDRAIALAFSQGRYERAFELTEQARSRAFLDSIANSDIARSNSNNPTIAKAEAEIRILDTRASALRSRALQEPEKLVLKETLTSLAVKKRALDELWSQMNATDNAAGLKYGGIQVPHLKRIQEAIPPGLTLVSYYVSSRVSVAFIVSTSEFHGMALPADAGKIDREILLLRDAPSLSRLPNVSPLWNYLIAPLVPFLGTRMLAVIPYGRLNYLSFTSLRNADGYLGERFVVFNLPSASSLQFLRLPSSTKSGRFAAVVASGVPGTAVLSELRDAIEELGQHTKGTVVFGKDATPSAFRLAAKGADQLIIASHGQLDPDAPLQSRVLLAADETGGGWLTVKDLFDVNLKLGSLVMMIGCDTSLGGVSSGEDIIALNRALLSSGAATVIASLWKVREDAATLTMRRFFFHLPESDCPAFALQAAQEDARKQFPHPMDWAAFTLTGRPTSSCFENPAAGR